MNESKTEKIVNIATKRGFFYPSSEIYGAKAGFWTYGHLGTLLKHKWENLWRSYFLSLDTNYFEIDDCTILPKEVFESSGHLENFNDPLTQCKKCNSRFRADELIQEKLNKEVTELSESALTSLIKENKIVCPHCQSPLSEVKRFNMMFPLQVGALGEETMYLRPESAQSPYLAFKRQFFAQREKLPLGLAVIGKAFRNEISPRQGFFRLREFTQAELQIFFNPEKLNEADQFNKIKNYKLQILFSEKKNTQEITCQDLTKKLPKFYIYHLAIIQKFYIQKLNVPKSKFRFRELDQQERAFYNKLHFDIEIQLDTLNGWKEVAGCHYRGDHDLLGHQQGSKEKLEVFIEEKRFIPHVLELSFGVDRNIWMLMDLTFKEEKERTLFAFPPCLAPFDVAVFPLVNKDKLPEKAQEVYQALSSSFKTFFDAKGSIGKMYRRMDEIGCPATITIDHQSLKDDTVTLRDLISMKQVRVKSKDLSNKLCELFNGEKLEKLGKLI